MELGLKGRVAIVGGGSQGIGKAVAFALAKEGVNLSICARGEEELAKTSDEIREKTGAKVIAVKADLTKSEDIDNFVKKTTETYGTVDILFNNAGGPPLKSFLETTDEEWDNAFNLNLMSSVRLSRAVIPYMRDKLWGRIINLTSVTVKQPLDKFVFSNSIRAGVVGFAKTLSNELAQFNITVNNVAPGFTLTKRLSEVFEKMADKNHVPVRRTVREVEDSIPMRRLATPEEIANVVVFLSSQCASYITGTTIQVDGGFVKGLM